VQVFVRDNNVDQALKVLKKKMQREGMFREMKLRGYYEKPSEKKTREKAEAIRRARKLARKKMQREGLLPMKPRVVLGASGKEAAPHLASATDRGKAEFQVLGKDGPQPLRCGRRHFHPLWATPSLTRGYSFREGQRSNTHPGGLA